MGYNVIWRGIHCITLDKRHSGRVVAQLTGTSCAFSFVVEKCGGD